MGNARRTAGQATLRCRKEGGAAVQDQLRLIGTSWGHDEWQKKGGIYIYIDKYYNRYKIYRQMVYYNIGIIDNIDNLDIICLY